MKDYKNLLIVALALIVLIFGGSSLAEPLHLANEQVTFFGGIVAAATIVFLIWMAVKVNRKEED
ncbi:MAG: hypothetical protein DRI65_16470 [Chloroflexota bacterium]|nr:MAG: hypothetical protein DRI65_16470 [Chloroflexota bacterium]